MFIYVTFKFLDIVDYCNESRNDPDQKMLENAQTAGTELAKGETT